MTNSLSSEMGACRWSMSPGALVWHASARKRRCGGHRRTCSPQCSAATCERSPLALQMVPVDRKALGEDSQVWWTWCNLRNGRSSGRGTQTRPLSHARALARGRPNAWRTELLTGRPEERGVAGLPTRRMRRKMKQRLLFRRGLDAARIRGNSQKSHNTR